MQAIARALYAFQGEEDGDLSFNEDDIIRILRQVSFVSPPLLKFRMRVGGGRV